MRAVDTNVLVRILARDDPKQVRVADEFVSAGAWVSLLALAETHNTSTTGALRIPSEYVEVVGVRRS